MSAPARTPSTPSSRQRRVPSAAGAEMPGAAPVVAASVESAVVAQRRARMARLLALGAVRAARTGGGASVGVASVLEGEVRDGVA